MADSPRHSAPGGSDVSELIKNMTPVVDPGIYAWLHFADEGRPLSLIQMAQKLTAYRVQMLFKEAEGWTAIVVEQDQYPEVAQISYISKMITLNVYSSLEAVGFMKVITERLASQGLSVNPVSAYFHDHLFVPVEKIDAAMQILRKMSEE